MERNQFKIEPAARTTLVNEYYFSSKLREVAELRAQGRDIINLGIGSPDLAPSEVTLSTLCGDSARSGVHGYQSYTGIEPLRRAFADWYKRYFNVTLNPDNEILPLIGSKEGIMHISMAFLNPGDKVLVPDPGYPAYRSASLLAGGEVESYNLKRANNWYPDFEELAGRDLSKVKIMWINYPHMPTGQPANIKVYERLVQLAHDNNFLICSDNPYSFILNNNHKSILSVDGAKDVAIELNSLSKSHNMPGWRVGMVAGKNEYISAILKVKSNMDSGMFYPLQTAAAVALSADNDWYEKLNTVYSGRRKKAEQMMDILGCNYDKSQTGLFLWGEIPDNIETGEEMCDKLLYEKSIFITPGSVFGKEGKRYIRISLCTDEKIFDIGLSRIKN
ncbi:MAG: aminotransferase class I/II-fold pyridoxal phosphate-dependent enzyme [Bacteroidales bacterium]|nr:aminotransferase class I/II-fold pyridoxal phosphate-dependent enzyme [Bacteroidales bacterium]